MNNKGNCDADGDVVSIADRHIMSIIVRGLFLRTNSPAKTSKYFH